MKKENVELLAGVHNALLTIRVSGQDTLTLANAIMALRSILKNEMEEGSVDTPAEEPAA